MDKLHHCLELGVLHEAVLDDVLDRLNVVVSGALHLLHLSGVGGEKLARKSSRNWLASSERGTSTISGMGELLEPAHLDDDARADERVLRHARRIFTLEP